jgi:putative membrane protein
VSPPGDGWRRLSPLSPLLRGGKVLAGLGALLVQQGTRQPSARVLLGVLAGGTLLAVLLGVASWRTTRYRLTATELQVDSGILRRRNRRVPLARLQSVDVVRPLAGRVLGVAQLSLEVVGGGSTEAPLAYLAEDEAVRLRARLLAAGKEGPADAPEPPERILVSVPPGVLLASILLGTPAVVTAGLLLLLLSVALADARQVPALLATLGPLAFGSASVVVRRLLAEYGFTVAESPDGLRLRHGLLETRASTIPAGRVQAVRTTQPLLWRPAGWVRVEVDVAGYAKGRGEEQAATSALLPVAPRALAEQLVARVLGADLPPVDRPVPRAARLRAPLRWRRLALGLDDAHLVTTTGVLTTTTDAVPLARVQGLRLAAGPWQRRLGLATVSADDAGRRLGGAVCPHRDVAEARLLLEELAGRCRAARRR